MRTQSRKVEMIDNLFKPVTNEKGKQVDEGIFWFDFLDYSCVVFITCGRSFVILMRDFMRFSGSSCSTST